MSAAISRPDPLRLPAALAARICHDIAGPLGALSATLELLAEDGDPEALAIARESATMLSARLRLLRAAWAEEVEVPGTRVMQILAGGLPNAERLRVTISLDADMAPSLRRLGLNPAAARFCQPAARRGHHSGEPAGRAAADHRWARCGVACFAGGLCRLSVAGGPGLA